MPLADLTFLNKEQKNDEKMNLYFERCRRGPPGRDGRGDGVLVRQRDWPRVSQTKAQPADIEIKRRLLLEY